MSITNYPLGVSGSHAHFNEPDPPECLNAKCCATLEREWEFCPYCGWQIDWDEIEGNDWYADEGERFLRNEVYEPLRKEL